MSGREEVGGEAGVAEAVSGGALGELLQQASLESSDREVDEAVSQLLQQMNVELSAAGTTGEADGAFAEQLVKEIGYTPLRDEIASAKQKHGQASAVADQVAKLAKALSDLGRSVYTGQSVQAYLAAALKPFQDANDELRPRRDLLRQRHRRWGWISLTGTAVGIGLGIWGKSSDWPWWGYICLVVGWVALLCCYVAALASHELQQEKMNANWREWKAVPIGSYPHPIPGDVLRLALAIHRAVPEAAIEVVQLCDWSMKVQLDDAIAQKEAARRREAWLAWWNGLSPEERLRLQDPLLRVRVGVGHQLERCYYVAAWNEPSFHPVDTTIEAEG